MANEGELKQPTLQERVDKMRSAGIDPNAIVELMVPVIEETSRRNAEAAEARLALKLEEKTKGLGEVIAKLNAIADTSAGPRQEVQNQQDPNQPAKPQGGDFLNTIAALGPILKLFGIGGGPGGDGGLVQMVKLAESYGTMMTALMKPINDMIATQRSTVFQEMTTYTKTGGQLPWEKTTEPAGRVIDVTPKANLNQTKNVDYGAEAEQIAKRIRLTK